MKKLKKQSGVRTVLLYIFLGILALFLVGFIYEQISEFIDSKTIKAPGQLIQVGDHKMHIYCTGEKKTDEPIVMLEAGAGNFYTTWSAVQPEIAKKTRVCSYDRLGHGFSESGNNESIDDIADNLHSLLEKSGNTGPIILVGHSIGGAYIRVYANKYPDNIKGMLMIDPAEENGANLILANASPLRTTLQKSSFRLLVGASYFSFARIVNFIDPTILNPAYRATIRNISSMNNAVGVTPKSVNASLKELSYTFIKDSLPPIKKANNFGNIPLVVLGADYKGEYIKCQNGHEQLAKISTSGKCLLIKNTDHYIQYDQPQVVIKQIEEMLSN